LGISEYDF
jgi:hypothetical protein